METKTVSFRIPARKKCLVWTDFDFSADRKMEVLKILKSFWAKGFLETQWLSHNNQQVLRHEHMPMKVPNVDKTQFQTQTSKT